MDDLFGLCGVDLSPWNWYFWDILLGLFYWDCAAILLGSGSGPFVSPIEDAIAAHGATFSFVVSYYSLKKSKSLSDKDIHRIIIDTVQ